MNATSVIRKLFYLNASVFLLLVFGLPRVLQNEKIILIAILLLFSVLLNRLRIAIRLFVVYLLFFIPTYIVAAMYGNEESLIFNALKIYYFFPFLLYFIFMTFTVKEIEEMLIKIARVVIIVTCLSTIISFLYGLGISPININSYFYEKEKYVGIHEGYYQIVNSPLSYLLFLVPLYFYKRVKLNFRSLDLYLFIFAFAVCIISGRRILILPFILIMIANFKEMKYFLLLTVIILLVIIFNGGINGLYLDTFYERLTNAIQSKGDSSVRAEQQRFFMQHILRKPVFGYGLGGYMTDYLRNSDFKTAYESSLHYLVFIMGIPLSLMLGLFYIYLGRKVRNNTAFRYNFRIGLLLACVSMLLGSYTNPYWLSSSDYCLPLAIVFRVTQKK